MACMWRWEDNFSELILYFYRVGSREQTQVLRFSSQRLPWMSHLTAHKISSEPKALFTAWSHGTSHAGNQEAIKDIICIDRGNWPDSPPRIDFSASKCLARNMWSLRDTGTSWYCHDWKSNRRVLATAIHWQWSEAPGRTMWTLQASSSTGWEGGQSRTDSEDRNHEQC